MVLTTSARAAAATLLLGTISACAQGDAAPAQEPAAKETAIDDDAAEGAVSSDALDIVMVPFTDVYTTTVQASADAVWAHLKGLYIEGGRTRQQGYDVMPLDDDITAYLGGTRAVNPDLESRREVIIRVSALDEEARLMALFITLDDMTPIYVVHQVRPDGEAASVYQTIIQTQMPVSAPEGGELTADYVREKMLADVAFHNSEVDQIFAGERAILEAAD
ncbi:MAG: hypothetical protein V2J26_02040 [Pacificimonas sp.]|nr:hypothetical protein [Pacificimonas sp.]